MVRALTLRDVAHTLKAVDSLNASLALLAI